MNKQLMYLKPFGPCLSSIQTRRALKKKLEGVTCNAQEITMPTIISLIWVTIWSIKRKRLSRPYLPKSLPCSEIWFLQRWSTIMSQQELLWSRPEELRCTLMKLTSVIFAYTTLCWRILSCQRLRESISQSLSLTAEMTFAKRWYLLMTQSRHQLYRIL